MANTPPCCLRGGDVTPSLGNCALQMDAQLSAVHAAARETGRCWT